MLKTLIVLYTIVIIIAVVFLVMGIKCLKNDKYNKKGIRYVLVGTNIIGTCIILSAILFIPVFFPT